MVPGGEKGRGTLAFKISWKFVPETILVQGFQHIQCVLHNLDMALIVQNTNNSQRATHWPKSEKNDVTLYTVGTVLCAISACTESHIRTH